MAHPELFTAKQPENITNGGTKKYLHPEYIYAFGALKFITEQLFLSNENFKKIIVNK